MPIETTQEITSIFGPFLSEVREIGFGFFFVFLVLALIREFLQGVSGQASYERLFIRILILGGVFFIYTPLFEEITRGMHLLANFFMPDEEFRAEIQKLFTAYKQNQDLGFIAWVKMTVLEWSVQGTYNLAYILLRIFSFVIVVLLSALYLLGPIFLGIGVLLPEMAANWVRWVFEIETWQVVLALFVRVLTELNFFQFYDQQKPFELDLVAMNFVVILIMVLFVPLFSSMLIRGSGISGAAGTVLGVGSALAFRQATRGARSSAEILKNTTRGIKERFFPRPPQASAKPSYKGGL